MNTYKASLADGVIRLPDGAFIPNDPRSADWHDYQAWLAAGNVLLPLDAPAAPPTAAVMNADCVTGITAPPAPQLGFDLRRAFIAKCISDEAYRLGVAPGALTNAQLVALRSRIAAIYQAL